MQEKASRPKMCQSQQLQSQNVCDKRHFKLCKRYVQEGYCVIGEKCDYLHRENEVSSDQKILNERVEELTQVLNNKSPGEKKFKMQLKS